MVPGFTLLKLGRHCFFSKLKVCGSPRESMAVGAKLPTALAHFTSLESYFGNCCNISNFFILVIFVRLICGQ